MFSERNCLYIRGIWLIALLFLLSFLSNQVLSQRLNESASDTLQISKEAINLSVEAENLRTDLTKAINQGFSKAYSDSILKVKNLLLGYHSEKRPGKYDFDFITFTCLDTFSNDYFLSNISYYKLKVEKEVAEPPLISRKSEIDSMQIKEEVPGKIFIKNRDKIRNEWVFLIIFLSFLLLTLLRYNFQRLFSRIFRSAISIQETTKLYRENPIPYSAFSRYLSLIFYINAGLFLFLLTRYFGYRIYNFSEFLTFAILCGGLLIFFFLKSTLYRMLGYLFSNYNLTKEFLFNAYIYRRIAGIFLLPIVTGIAFIHNSLTEVFIFLGFLLLIISYLLQMLRGVFMISRRQVQLYYFILYFCTLEILPPLALYRLFFLVK
jgi:hypothetical protein